MEIGSASDPFFGTNPDAPAWAARGPLGVPMRGDNDHDGVGPQLADAAGCGDPSSRGTWRSMTTTSGRSSTTRQPLRLRRRRSRCTQPGYGPSAEESRSANSGRRRRSAPSSRLRLRGLARLLPAPLAGPALWPAAALAGPAALAGAAGVDPLGSVPAVEGPGSRRFVNPPEDSQIGMHRSKSQPTQR